MVRPFRILHRGGRAAKILIDPFLSDNPSWDKGWEEHAEGVTHVLLTHGHNDHVGDALARFLPA
jgi:L-ascorbate metabolism protein UlaG (beta-lactamase superfamily)